MIWEGSGEKDKVHDDVWSLSLKTLEVTFALRVFPDDCIF